MISTTHPFTLFDLSTIAVAIENQRKIALEEYNDKVDHLDRLSQIVRREIDSLSEAKRVERAERDFSDFCCGFPGRDCE